MNITKLLHRLGAGQEGAKTTKSDVPPAHVSARPNAAVVATVARHPALRWLWHDIPYITMLLLAMIGVTFRLPFAYWILLTPVFGVISIATGWHHFASRDTRLELVYRLVLSWGAILLAIYLLFSGGVQGVLNANANSLSMLTLLALGTFITGVEAREWRICAVGGALFLAVPGLGWLDQSPLLLTAAAAAVIALGGFAWWINETREDKGVSP